MRSGLATSVRWESTWSQACTLVVRTTNSSAYPTVPQRSHHNSAHNLCQRCFCTVCYEASGLPCAWPRIQGCSRTCFSGRRALGLRTSSCRDKPKTSHCPPWTMLHLCALLPGPKQGKMAHGCLKAACKMVWYSLTAQMICIALGLDDSCPLLAPWMPDKSTAHQQR